MRNLLLLIVLQLPLIAWSQVVNIEKLREDMEASGFDAELTGTFGLTRNKAGQTLNFGGQLRLDWLQPKSQWYLFGGYNLTQFNNIDEPGSAPKNFTNNGFGHLRYNYQVNPIITWEAFSQVQYDEIQELQIRVLAGTGPRFQLLDQDSFRLYLGAIGMYEYEESFEQDISEMDSLAFHRDFRASIYLAGAVSITPWLNLRHITYYQPLLEDLGDYRISSETNFMVQISKNLNLTTMFKFVYDDAPPETVPNLMYRLSNGINITF